MASWALGKQLASKSPLYPSNGITIFDVLGINPNDCDSEKRRLVIFFAVLVKSGTRRVSGSPPTPRSTFHFAGHFFVRPIKIESPLARGMESTFPNRRYLGK